MSSTPLHQSSLNLSARHGCSVYQAEAIMGNVYNICPCIWPYATKHHYSKEVKPPAFWKENNCLEALWENGSPWCLTAKRVSYRPSTELNSWLAQTLSDPALNQFLIQVSLATGLFSSRQAGTNPVVSFSQSYPCSTHDCSWTKVGTDGTQLAALALSNEGFPLARKTQIPLLGLQH